MLRYDVVTSLVLLMVLARACITSSNSFISTFAAAASAHRGVAVGQTHRDVTRSGSQASRVGDGVRAAGGAHL